jgi:carbon starvation protein CstA
MEVVMKKWIKVSMVFLGGLIAGGVLTFIILGQISYLQYRDYVMMAAREQVFIASELRAHRELELQNRAEANLPQIVLTIHNDQKLQKATQAPLVMRSIRDFYELNGVPVPKEIAGIISTLPPRVQ